VTTSPLNLTSEPLELAPPAAVSRLRGHAFAIGLTICLLVGLALRLAIIVSPLGEIDGDEAVVGLMARHIAFLG